MCPPKKKTQRTEKMYKIIINIYREIKKKRQRLDINFTFDVFSFFCHNEITQATLPFSAALSTCNSINQERARCMCIGKSHIHRSDKTKSDSEISLFYCTHSSILLKRENFLSVTQIFPILFPFFRIGKSFFLFYYLCWRSFRSILSQYCPVAGSLEKTFFFLFALPIYRMRGLTDFAITSPLRLGKKLLEIFDWLTPFFSPLRSQSYFRVLLWTSHLTFDFYRFR